MSLRRRWLASGPSYSCGLCVEKHLGDFGVDPESASYTQINRPSGGTKMKFVLAAAESTFFESCVRSCVKHVPKFAGFLSR